MEACDVLLVVGTSGVVQPAAGLPRLAKRYRKPVVEINPEASSLTPIADVVCQARAAEALPLIVSAMRERPDA